MVIWSGFGIVVPFIALLTAAMAEFIAEAITGDDHFYQQHRWLILVAMILAAALNYGFHLLLLREKGRVVIDKETGQEITLRTRHALFFIPVRWWSLIFVIVGLVLAFSGGSP